MTKMLFSENKILKRVYFENFEYNAYLIITYPRHLLRDIFLIKKN